MTITGQRQAPSTDVYCMPAILVDCSIPTNFYFLIEQFLVNTFAAGLIQAVRTKTACSHVALHGHNSGAKSRRELFKHSKYSEVL